VGASGQGGALGDAHFAPVGAQFEDGPAHAAAEGREHGNRIGLRQTISGPQKQKGFVPTCFWFMTTRKSFATTRKAFGSKTMAFLAAVKAFVTKDNDFASTRKAFVPVCKACLTTRKGRHPGHNVLLHLERLLDQLESPLRQLERPFHQLERLFQQNKSELAVKGVFWPVMSRNLTERVSKWNNATDYPAKGEREFLTTDKTPMERRFFQARGAGVCVD